MAIFAVVLIAIGSLICLLNWATLVATIRTKRFVSAVPLIGALALGTGLALLPETRPFALIALVADYGTLVLILAIPRMAYELWSTSRVNLVHRFVGDESGRCITISLFRRNIAIISCDFDPPVPCNQQGARIASFGKVGKWAPTDSGFSISDYSSDRQLLVSKQGSGHATIELNYPSDEAFKYDCLDGLTVREQD